jgi:hypothetical protein
MSNYLKKILFAVLILMMPNMNSASKAMDSEDFEGSTIRAHKVSFVTEDQKDVSSSVQQSTSYQVESLEDSQTSWASYLISPVKFVFQSSYELMNFATQSPQKALFVGAFLTYQVAAVAAQCSCNCVCNGPVGVSPSILDCVKTCNLTQQRFNGCYIR